VSTDPGYFIAPYTVINGPITDADLTKMYQEAGLDAKAYLDKRDKAKAVEKQYYIDHAACPECGHNKYSSTYVGYIISWDHPETFKDENDVRCGHCGWKGITHDLVKKPLP
jgi:DNA-directed RNA polymerase subunit RPC12/RpoP